MAIVENFYNNDRARDIRDILTNNFANVARYIPNNFLILTTTERQNLPEDWKTHFKLVFDKEVERVYRWSEIERNWKQYLIYAWDDYARREITSIGDSAFVEVELGKNITGEDDPYTFTFYSREFDEVDGATGKVTHHNRQAVDSVTLNAINVKFNNEYSVQTVIQKLLDDLKSLDDFVGNRDDILQNSDLTAKTVAGAIKEVNNKTIENKDRLDNIENGTTKVPEALHAEKADLAEQANMAKDSERFGGELPSFYAKQSDLDKTNDQLNKVETRVSKTESDINDLIDKTDTTNENLSALEERVDGQDNKLNLLTEMQEAQGTEIDSIQESIAGMENQIGWEILL